MENIIAALPASLPRRFVRSAGAVLAGFITILVTHTGTDAVLHALGVFPPAGQAMSDALFALAFSYRFSFSVLGAYVTAWLAPTRPLKHALVLGGIGFVLSLAGLAATVARAPELGPVWYPLALVAVTFPCCWLGAKLR